jgi:UDP-glucose 4-epimerase
MIKHDNLQPTNPSRVVILGANGFLGGVLRDKLHAEGIPVLAVGRSDIDLSCSGSADVLAKLLKPSDALIVLSAITPDKGRDLDVFMRNLNMGLNICKALEKTPVDHTIYLSSDAVYSAELSLVTEKMVAAPSDLYGTMHKAREVMFQTTLPATHPLAILRLTIAFGLSDTHNSYGPNRFRRTATQEKKITLFGDGEEMRDHIFVEDAVQVILAVLRYRTRGIFNLATGKSYSFKQVAEKIAALYDYPVEIICTPRKSPITHRHYDIAQIYKAFPQIQWTTLDDALSTVHQGILESA